MTTSWLLTLMTFLPAAAGLLLTVVRSEKAVKVVSLGATLAVLALSGLAFALFDPGRGAELQLACGTDWIPALHIRYGMGVDGIALSMVVLTALLAPLCLACSWHSIKDRARGFFISFLFLETGILGVFCATDLFLFYVFWEATLIPMYLIIGIWGGPRRVYATLKFVLFTMAGSLLMLAAVLYCYGRAGTFDIEALQALLPARIGDAKGQGWLFLAFALAFAIKVPLFPFHTWLPDAHVEAPTAGSVILAGVLLKMGTYGFLRFAIPFFPAAAVEYSGWITALALVSIVYGALMSMVQTDIKKLIAYSSVSHLGFVMLGLFGCLALVARDPAGKDAAVAGFQGGVLQMVNHGLSTGGLFLLVGMIYDRTHRRGVGDFGGLAAGMPLYATLFLIVTLSSIGLPGLNGFVGEFLVIRGGFAGSPYYGAIAATGVILGALYMLRLYRDVFFGPVPAARSEAVPDATRGELLMLAPLLALIVLLGIVPALVLDRTEPAVRKVVNAVHEKGKGSATDVRR